MFAKRTNWELTPNRLSRKLAELKRRGEEIIDLTESNPTRIGLEYPEGLLRELADPRSLRYEPDPKGFLPARRTVAGLFAAKGVPVDPGQILLTASTSEAYSILFQLLADPGDEVLTPRPSYPLFDYLAGLNGLETVPYRLRLGRNGRWQADLDHLRQAVSARTRALVLVHPNNPTGSCAPEDERAEIFALCTGRGIAVISDEVFAEYIDSSAGPFPETLLSEGGGLVFALGGLSKWMGLPQMKLSWIACAGPSADLSAALARLEVITDTALSVSAPVQAAFPRWAAWAPAVQDQIRRRVQANRQWLEKTLPPPVKLLGSDGGWNAVLKVFSLGDDEAWALALLEKARVSIHPGYFYDFEEQGIAVVSLLPPAQRFQEGIKRIIMQS